ncbi:DUF47 family protein [Halanaerobiaceae bacterium Z-7014]|uniref:DUF47 family protein n=1 Tax=Halonatronomonas betaini TaxID=2778430 RepID=A0A931AMC5_9FIRM|nr:DUF47 family protein [Halonatronomonas betaini]MBF8435453.1 DUF47 family protein [Halonatronomonas betaini]
MIKLFKESDKLEVNLVDLTELVGKCMANSLEALFLYLEEGESHEVKVLIDTVHEYESKADKLRREIITSILDGRLMPNTRSDILNLVESIDDIADFSEDIIDEIIFLRLKFTYLDLDRARQMQELLLEQFEKLIDGLKLLFIEMNQALVYARQLEEIESKLDDIEEEMIREIGQNQELDAAEKLSHRNLIKNISDLADIIEKVGDVMEVIVSVRHG